MSIRSRSHTSSHALLFFGKSSPHMFLSWGIKEQIHDHALIGLCWCPLHSPLRMNKMISMPLSLKKKEGHSLLISMCQEIFEWAKSTSEGTMTLLGVDSCNIYAVSYLSYLKTLVLIPDLLSHFPVSQILCISRSCDKNIYMFKKAWKSQKKGKPATARPDLFHQHWSGFGHAVAGYDFFGYNQLF